MFEYSEKVLAHFRSPKNVGEMGDPSCGDFMKVFIVEDSVVKDVKYQMKGCPASIVCASAMAELAMGKHLDDAMVITDDDIVQVLDGFPDFKIHCSALGASGLAKAIMDYSLR